MMEAWYKDLVSHGATHGVFIPPYESIVEEDIMGELWDRLPEGKKAQKADMSQVIYSLLRMEDTISSSLTAVHEVMQGARGDGYVILYNMMRTIHPRLRVQKYSSNAPYQKSNESIAKYMGRALLH